MSFSPRIRALAKTIGDSNKHKDLIGFLVLHAILAVGILIAIRSVEPSQVHLDLTSMHTRYGYTRSLILFIVPCTVFGLWLYNWIKRGSNRRRAFHWTVGSLAVLGILLDFFFGRTFFTFKYEPAVIKCLKLPGYDFWAGNLQWGAIPFEEMLFYCLGFLAILLTYLWADDVLFGESKIEMNQNARPSLWNVKKNTLSSFIVAVKKPVFASSVVAAFFTIVAIGISETIGKEKGCFPSYFLFLVWLAAVPTAICFKLAFHFVNWRAMCVTWLFILFISQFWEACLALPYQWWDYQPKHMMGIFIKPLCDLPLEAILVWSLATWTTIIIYETVLYGLQFKKWISGGTSPGGLPRRDFGKSPGPTPGGPNDSRVGILRILSAHDEDVELLKRLYAERIASRKLAARVHADREPISWKTIVITVASLVVLIFLSIW